jgi:hypothetical protein
MAQQDDHYQVWVGLQGGGREIETASAITQLLTNHYQVRLPYSQHFSEAVRGYSSSITCRGLIQDRGEEIRAHPVAADNESAVLRCSGSCAVFDGRAVTNVV